MAFLKEFSWTFKEEIITSLQTLLKKIEGQGIFYNTFYDARISLKGNL